MKETKTFMAMAISCLLIGSCKKTDTTTAPTYGTMFDIDSNTYKTVTIGTQVWMAENLKVTKYNDGTTIPFVTDCTAWSNSSTPCYCWYNNDAATYKNTYGALYNWYTVNTGKLAPKGWHIPTDAEWTILTTYLGGESPADGKLRETGTTHWLSNNTGATNSSGFSALPGGNRGEGGGFISIGNGGYWWSSTELNTSLARNRSLYYGSTFVSRDSYKKYYGYSIRCIRD